MQSSDHVCIPSTWTRGRTRKGRFTRHNRQHPRGAKGCLPRHFKGPSMAMQVELMVGAHGRFRKICVSRSLLAGSACCSWPGSLLSDPGEWDQGGARHPDFTDRPSAFPPRTQWEVQSGHALGSSARPAGPPMAHSLIYWTFLSISSSYLLGGLKITTTNFIFSINSNIYKIL